VELVQLLLPLVPVLLLQVQMQLV
jgi:hypothetical protein